MPNMGQFFKDKEDFIKSLETKDTAKYERDYNNIILVKLVESATKKQYENATKEARIAVQSLRDSEQSDGTMKSWRNGK